jgi:hypothetical protein
MNKLGNIIMISGILLLLLFVIDLKLINSNTLGLGNIIFGIIFAMSVVSIAYFMVTHIKKVNMMFIVNSVLILLNSFLAYFANRLLHTMCVKAI